MLLHGNHTYTDVSDLQNFVNVALATAAGGEDDFANDRLSSLRTVGSGFSSLIYKLEEDTGFHELSERCLAVWTAYKNDRNLPTMLVLQCYPCIHRYLHNYMHMFIACLLTYLCTHTHTYPPTPPTHPTRLVPIPHLPQEKDY